LLASAQWFEWIGQGKLAQSSALERLEALADLACKPPGGTAGITRF
jgi:hypothetical protein